MNENKNAKKPSRRARAAMRAGEIRRRRIAEARERETQIEATVVDVLAARLAIEEAGYTIADGIERLKALGETQDSIAAVCEMSVHEVRTLHAQARRATAAEATGGATSAMGRRPSIESDAVGTRREGATAA